MITITHTRPEGTIVEGTARGDGTAPILKANGFRWAPSLRAWIVQQSRDHAAKTWKINGAAESLRAAGFDVEVSVDETPRAFAEAEAERTARAEVRADVYADRAVKAASVADSAAERVQQIAEMVGGQPILVGHHSENRARADQRRIHDGTRKSLDEGRKAEHYESAAETAGQYQGRRESLGTTLRRIERLEADQRRYERGWDDYATHPSYLQNADELTYWKQVVAKQEAAGAKVWSRADFAKGDQVLCRNRWYPVLRVNAKTVTVPSGYSWTDSIRYDDVQDQRSA